MTNWNLLSAVAWFYESLQVNFCSATWLMAVQFWFAATPYVWWSCKITPARRCSPSRNSCSSMSMGGLILSVRSSSSSSSSRNSKQDMHLLRHLIFSFAFQLVFNAGFLLARLMKPKRQDGTMYGHTFFSWHASRKSFRTTLESKNSPAKRFNTAAILRAARNSVSDFLPFWQPQAVKWCRSPFWDSILLFIL